MGLFSILVLKMEFYIHSTNQEGMATYSSILAWRIPMGRGSWWATVHEVTKSQTQLSD